jgi:hypothetical protein
VADLAESTDGTVIAATTRGLSRFEAGTWKDVTKGWNFPGKQAKHLYFDKAGSLCPIRRQPVNGSLGQVVVAFFEEHLKVQKGLRPGTIRSYRDTIKLLLVHVAALCSRPITSLTLKDRNATSTGIVIASPQPNSAGEMPERKP